MRVRVLQVKQQREIFGLSPLYWGLWLAILILWMGRFVTSFLSIYLVSALHIDEGVVGAVVAMYGFGSIVGCLFGGTLSDRFGRQSMIIIGEIGAAIALLTVSVLTDPIALGAALFVYGSFASLPSPAIAAYIADVVPVARQQRAYVLQSWAINFGYAIGPIIANQLVKVSYAMMFYVEAAVMIAVTVLLIGFFREVQHLGITVPRMAAGDSDGKSTGKSVKQVTEEIAELTAESAAGKCAGSATEKCATDSQIANTSIETAAATAATASTDRDECANPKAHANADHTSHEKRNGSTQSHTSAAPASLRDNWNRVLTDWPFLAFAVLMFGYYLVYFQSTSGLPIAMTNLGMGLSEYSILLTINGFMLCALQIPAMKLFARMGNSRVLIAGLAVTVIGYAVQIVANSWAGFACAVVLWTLGELGTFPIATTIVASMAPASARGTYQGVYNVLWSLSIALAPLIGGGVISRFGGHALWIACTVALIVVTAGMRVTKTSRDNAIGRNLSETLTAKDSR